MQLCKLKLSFPRFGEAAMEMNKVAGNGGVPNGLPAAQNGVPPADSKGATAPAAPPPLVDANGLPIGKRNRINRQLLRWNRSDLCRLQ